MLNVIWIKSGVKKKKLYSSFIFNIYFSNIVNMLFKMFVIAVLE